MHMDMTRDREKTEEEITLALKAKGYSDQIVSILFIMLQDDFNGPTTSAKEIVQILENVQIRLRKHHHTH